jgi:LysM repeat protein
MWRHAGGVALLLAATAAGAAAGDGYGVHTVRPGDTLWDVARAGGADPAEVVRANAIENPRHLPLGLRVVVSGAREEPLRGLDGLLARAETELRTARFDAALASAEEARPGLEAVDPEAARPRLAHLELVVATVHIAYGREEKAIEHLLNALAQGSEIPLDPDMTSPRILRVVEAARRRHTGAEAGSPAASESAEAPAP